MKKFLFFILSMLLLCACSKNEPTVVETGTLEVNCYQAIVSQINAPSRATSSNISSMSKIVYIILDSEGAVSYTSEQNSGDTDFGTLSANIAVGDYTLLIYASGMNTPVVVNNDGTITITKCGGAYSNHTTFSISRNSRTTVNLELNRCVAKISFASVEDIPSNVTKCRIVVSGNSTIYDILQGKGLNTTSYDTDELSISTCTAEGKFKNSVYVILPAEETTVGLSFSFYDSSNTLLYTHSFTNVPVKKNCQTNFSAALFHEHGVDGTNVTINTTWGEPISAEY